MILGIDPGNQGAFALLNPDTGSLMVWDMPTFQMTIGRTRKTRIDPVQVDILFEGFKAAGCRLAVMESVGGRPRQSAHNAFTFGWGAGLIYMACVTNRIPPEPVPPSVWKRMMRAPKEKEAAVARADELFPEHRHLFRGKRNGLMDGRAEAALLALFGAVHVKHAKPHDREWAFITGKRFTS
jgi:hypothetical protein